MKKLADGNEVSDRTYHYLLDFNECDQKDYLVNKFRKERLCDLNVAEYWELFQYATQTDNKTNINTKGKESTFINCLYPTLEDIRLCCRVIANGIEDLPLMLSKEDTTQLRNLTTKWMAIFRIKNK